MEIEAILLTGGASRRMGTDKAEMLVDGQPMALRIGLELAKACDPVTVLGTKRLEPFEFVADEGVHRGPLPAISRFEATKPYVFIASCDLVRFDARLVAHLSGKIGAAQAAIPVLEGREQPLCALYHSDAFLEARRLVASGESRVMKWIAALDCVLVPERDVPDSGWMRNVNSPADLAETASRLPTS